MALVSALILAGCGGGSASTGAPPDEPADIVDEVTSVRPFVPRTEDCVPRGDRPPDAPVSSEDPPTCDDPSADRLGAVTVEQEPDRQLDDQLGLPAGDKAIVTVSTDTRVLRQAADGFERATFDDLDTGRQVAVWYRGPVAESYPVQATAATIVIRPSG